MCAKLGNDNKREQLHSKISECNLNLDYVDIEDCSTGQALIFSYPQGDNSIVIVPGANAKWEISYQDFINKYSKPLNSDIILMQREIPEYING